MAKPSGQLQLNTSHALYANIKGLVICEDDGKIRELVTDVLLGTKLTGTLGPDIGVAEVAAGSLLGTDVVSGISTAGFIGTDQFSFAIFGGLPAGIQDIFNYGENSTTFGGAYNVRATTNNWSSTSVRPYLKGGWSGSGPIAGNIWAVDTTTAVLRGWSTTITGGAWSTDFFEAGVNEANSTTALNSSYDPPRSGVNTYLNLNGASNRIIVYAVVFDKALSNAEWASLNTDPYSLIQAVGGGGTTTAITGVQAAGAVGTISTTSDANIAITGVSAAGVVGALTISTGANASVTLTGIESVGQAGSLAVLSSPTITLTGVGAAGQVGALSTVSGTSITISGVTATGSVGSLSIQSDTTVTLGGLSAAGQVGTVIIPQGASVTPTGVTASGAAGVLTVSLSGEWVIQAQAGGTWTMQPQSSDTWTEQPITSKTWTIQ